MCAVKHLGGSSCRIPSAVVQIMGNRGNAYSGEFHVTLVEFPPPAQRNLSAERFGHVYESCSATSPSCQLTVLSVDRVDLQNPLQ